MTSEYQHKILSLDQLAGMVADARSRKLTVVQCHGCFDIVHPGHIRYLQFARKQGDLLIVSLTGDGDVGKGGQRPYIPQELRAENLAALLFVDAVYINPEATAESLLRLVQPDVYVKGCEYEDSTDPGFLSEKRVVEEEGGRIIFSSGEIVFSSSALIERMSPNTQLESQRLKLLRKRCGITAASCAELTERFRDVRVLVLGDIVLDRYVLCDALGVAHESPMMSLVERDERTYVGGAAIVARHVTALGGRAFLLAAGAADESDRTVREVLTGEGVEFNLIPSRPSLVHKTRFLVDDAKLFKVDRAQRLPLDSVAEKQAAILLEQQSKIADAVIFCDFGYGTITGSLLRRILPTLRHNVRTLTADVSGGRNSLLDFRHVDLLSPTEREARATLNDFDSGLSSVAWNILQRTQAKHAFITLGKHGMIVFQRRSERRASPDWSARLKSEQLPSFCDHAVDLLGCGDALLAASTMALASGADLMHAAYLGNTAAAWEASILGNQPLDGDQFLRRLRHPTPAQADSNAGDHLAAGFTPITSRPRAGIVAVPKPRAVECTKEPGRDSV